MPKALSQEDKKWFKYMKGELVEDGGKDRFGSSHTFPGRPITPDEFKRLQELVHSHELPCRFSSWVYGGTVVRICEHVEVNPSIKTPPEMLVYFWDSQIPSGGTQFANAKRLLNLFHSPRNAEMLSYYGLQPVNVNPSFYVY